MPAHHNVPVSSNVRRQKHRLLTPSQVWFSTRFNKKLRTGVSKEPVRSRSGAAGSLEGAAVIADIETYLIPCPGCKPMNKLKSILKSLICAAGAVACAAHAQSSSDSRVQHGLHSFAESMNKQLPLQLDRFTRLDSIVPGPGRQLNYWFTILEMPATGDDVKEFERQMKRHAVLGLCNDPNMAVFRRDGVKVGATYLSSNGKFFARITTSRDDC